MSREILQHVLEQAGIHEPLTSIRDLTGGCIHQVCLLELAGGRKLVAKFNHAGQKGLFEEEMASLGALADTDTILTPTPLGVYIARNHAVLLMSHLEPGSANDASWRSLGENLAALHQTDVGMRYGYQSDNHIGATFQPNGWCEDWISFNAEHRLGFQLKLAGDAGLLTGQESARIRCVVDRLDRLIPKRPRPSLLHGDLWSGNALETVDAGGEPCIAIIDPAASIGDGWADIAMMKLFGGFSSSCFEAYAALNDDQDQLPERIAVYQLYHVLNHVNLFGRGYVGQALALADGLL